MDRNSPLRGKSLRERRRILKVTRSEIRIEDPEDARLAHQLYEYLSSRRRSLRPPAVTFMEPFAPWITTVGFGAVAAYTAVHSEWTWVALFTGFIAVSWVAWRIPRLVYRRMDRTAELNGWS